MKTAILPLLVVALGAGGATAQNAPSLRDLRVTSFRPEGAGDPTALADAFLGRHADDILGLTVLQQLADHDEREGKAAAATEHRLGRKALEAKLGITQATLGAE